MGRLKVWLISGLLAAVVLVGGGLMFGQTVAFWLLAQEPAPVFVQEGVAIRGYDPVAYFRDRRPVQGNEDHAYAWNDAVWHFASAEHKQLFEADPERYAPQYGGFCAWGVAEKGMLFTTQPENWSIVDDKLYLNFNDDIQVKWNGDPAGFIERGDHVWPGLRG